MVTPGPGVAARQAVIPLKRTPPGLARRLSALSRRKVLLPACHTRQSAAAALGREPVEVGRGPAVQQGFHFGTPESAVVPMMLQIERDFPRVRTGIPK